MKNPHILIILLITIVHTKDIFLHHDQKNQQIEIFKFFHDVNDGYYVDIGAYDPIFITNTINLYVKGWSGMNIEAHPNRFQQFPAIRPYDVNLNIAISDSQKYIKFYQYSGDVSQSTAKQDVYNQMNKRFFQILQLPAMSMKQICYRYFKKTPTFFSLDVQGLSTIALNSNDWNNSKCRPEVMLIEKDNIPGTINFTLLHKQMMAKLGYKFHSQFWYNQIYIQNTVYNHYIQKYKKGTQIFNSQKTSLRWQDFLPELYKQLKIPKTYPNIITARSISNFTHSYFYYYYPKQNTIFALQDVNLMSNQFSPYKNRPILILLYNPKNTKYVVLSRQYKREDFFVKSWKFDKISVTKANGEKFQVYIFNTYQQGHTFFQDFNISKNSAQQTFLQQKQNQLVQKQKQKQQQQQQLHKMQQKYIKQLQQKLLKQQNKIKEQQHQLQRQKQNQKKDPTQPQPQHNQSNDMYGNVVVFLFINVLSVTVISSIIIKIMQKRYKKKLEEQLQWQLEQSSFNQYEMHNKKKQKQKQGQQMSSSKKKKKIKKKSIRKNTSENIVTQENVEKNQGSSQVNN